MLSNSEGNNNYQWAFYKLKLQKVSDFRLQEEPNEDVNLMKRSHFRQQSEERKEGTFNPTWG